MKCNKCNRQIESKKTKTGEDRLPIGWHRFKDAVWCGDCWHKSYMLRAVAIPVAGPVEGAWSDMRAALDHSWADTTMVANWAVRELARQDRERRPEDAKLQKMPKVYLYPGARALCPRLSPTSVTSLLRAVEAKYRRRRLDTIWRSAASFANYRYPVPLPVHRDNWSVERQEGGAMILSCRIDEARWRLRLRGGHRHRRAMQALERFIAREAENSELTLYRVRAHEADPDGRVVDARPGGGRRERYELMAKMCLWLPRPAPGELEGTMLLWTCSDSFLKAEIHGRDPWILHAEHVKSWVIGHAARLQRWRDDSKYEKRWPKQNRIEMNVVRERWVEKHNNKISTWIKTASAMVAAYARRNKIKEVSYNDGNRDYLPSFPWAALKTRLEIKLDEYGIKLASAKVEKDSAKPLGEKEAES